MFSRLRSLFRGLRRRSEFENNLADELDFHREQYAADLVRSGLSLSEANRRARIEFGEANTVKEQCRQSTGLQPFDECVRQVRYAARSLRRAPAFTLTAILTVALCLGANLTVFAVVDAILVRPLPFPDPDRLVTIYNTYPKAGVDRDGASITNYYERRGALPAFSSLSIYLHRASIVGQPGSTVRNEVTLVSPDFFRTLQVPLARGRAFTEAEVTGAGDKAVIVSDRYWRQHWNSASDVVGRTIWVDSYPKTVVGVLPPGFRFLTPATDLYLPLATSLEQRSASNRHSGGNVIQMIARLQPGVTIAQAQSQLDAQNAALERDSAQAAAMADAGFRSAVASLHADQVTGVRPILLLLQAGVFTLLLMGAINLTNLLLVRAGSRFRELAVRQALGATRLHLATGILIETLLLTAVGGALALVIAAAGVRLVTALGVSHLPLGTEVAFNLRLGLAGLLAALTLALSLAAAITGFSIRLHPGRSLAADGRAGTARHAALALRHAFVVGQIALSFILLAGAGLLGLSLRRAMQVSPGFQSEGVVAGQISLVGNRYPNPASGLAFADRVAEQLGQQPGISAVGISTNIPFSGQNGKSAATVEAHIRRPGESPRGIYSYGVAGDFFHALGYTLRAGRFLTASDAARSSRYCVVDEQFARDNWPNASPIGQRLWQGSDRGSSAEAFTVVGVVARVRQAGLTDDAAQGAVYYPFLYRPDFNIFLIARGNRQSDILKAALASTLRRIDPDLALNNPQSMDDRISASLLDRRSPALLGGLFAAIALILTAIGTYGLISYAAAQRRREIAIRLAVGARPAQIERHFLSLALRLLGAGSLLGLLGVFLASRALQAVLYRVSGTSFEILVPAAVLIGLVAFAACVLPARRAARTSPLITLSS